MSISVNNKQPINGNITLTSKDIFLTEQQNITIYNKIVELEESFNDVNDRLGIVVGKDTYIDINSKIDVLYSTKQSIATSIRNKNVIIPSNAPFQEYPKYIDAIDVGSIQPPSTEEDVQGELFRFIDYDGTIIHQEYFVVGESVSYPKVVQKTGMEFVGWNHEFQKVSQGWDIGAIYDIKTMISTDDIVSKEVYDVIGEKNKSLNYIFCEYSEDSSIVIESYYNIDVKRDQQEVLPLIYKNGDSFFCVKDFVTITEGNEIYKIQYSGQELNYKIGWNTTTEFVNDIYNIPSKEDVELVYKIGENIFTTNESIGVKFIFDIEVMTTTPESETKAPIYYKLGEDVKRVQSFKEISGKTYYDIEANDGESISYGQTETTSSSFSTSQVFYKIQAHFDAQGGVVPLYYYFDGEEIIKTTNVVQIFGKKYYDINVDETKGQIYYTYWEGYELFQSNVQVLFDQDGDVRPLFSLSAKGNIYCTLDYYNNGGKYFYNYSGRNSYYKIGDLTSQSITKIVYDIPVQRDESDNVLEVYYKNGDEIKKVPTVIEQRYDISVKKNESDNVIPIEYCFLTKTCSVTVPYQFCYNIPVQKDELGNVIPIEYVYWENTLSNDVSFDYKVIYDIKVQRYDNDNVVPIIYYINSADERIYKTEKVIQHGEYQYYDIPFETGKYIYYSYENNKRVVKDVFQKNGKFYYDIPFNEKVLIYSFNDKDYQSTSTSVSLDFYKIIVNDINDVKEIKYVINGVENQTESYLYIGNDYIYNIPVQRNEEGKIYQVNYETLKGSCLKFNIQHDNDGVYIIYNIESFEQGSSITIDWGDETISDYKIEKKGIVMFEHTYANKGVYDIKFVFKGVEALLNEYAFCFMNTTDSVGNYYNIPVKKDDNGQIVPISYKFEQVENIVQESVMIGSVEVYNIPVKKDALDKVIQVYYCIGEKSNYQLTEAKLSGIRKIKDYTFANCYKLKTISLPQGLIYIGEYAFYNCVSLKNVNIPLSLIQVGDYSFANCYSLEKVCFSTNELVCGINSFQNCNSLQRITLNTVGVCNYSFLNCNSLREVCLVQKLDFIGISAFGGCQKLQKVYIKQGVKNISDSAFNSCYKLKELIFGDEVSVSNIGDFAFYNCVSLSTLYTKGQNQIFFDEGSKIGEKAFYKCLSISKLKINNIVGTLTFGKQSFGCCQSLTDILINSENVVFSESVFENCYKLKNFEVIGNVETYPSRLFFNCKSMRIFEISESVTSIQANVFGGCYSLLKVNVLGVEPPSIVQNSFDVDNIFNIYVLNESYDEYYKEWKYVSDKIVGVLNFEDKIPLTLIAKNGVVQIGINKIGQFETKEIYYRLEDSVDDETVEGWTKYTFGTSISLKEGEAVQFKSLGNKFSVSDNQYLQFFMKGTTTSRVFAKGELLSLVNYNSQINEYCFYSLFKDCSYLENTPFVSIINASAYCFAYMYSGCVNLIQASELIATTLADSCYSFMFEGCNRLINIPNISAEVMVYACYKGMFKNCSSLTRTIDLPSIELDSSCYESMFQGCVNITEVSELPATILATDCYKAMFKGCTNLQVAPKLPATTLVQGCYSSMFEGCNKLSYVDVEFTNWNRNDLGDVSTDSWLDGVATSGIFYRNENLPVLLKSSTPVSITYYSGIPNGWQIDPQVVINSSLLVNFDTKIGGDSFEDTYFWHDYNSTYLIYLNDVLTENMNFYYYLNYSSGGSEIGDYVYPTTYLTKTIVIDLKQGFDFENSRNKLVIRKNSEIFEIELKSANGFVDEYGNIEEIKEYDNGDTCSIRNGILVYNTQQEGYIGYSVQKLNSEIKSTKQSVIISTDGIQEKYYSIFVDKESNEDIPTLNYYFENNSEMTVEDVVSYQVYDVSVMKNQNDQVIPITYYISNGDNGNTVDIIEDSFGGEYYNIPYVDELLAKYTTTTSQIYSRQIYFIMQPIQFDEMGNVLPIEYSIGDGSYESTNTTITFGTGIERYYIPVVRDENGEVLTCNYIIGGGSYSTSSTTVVQTYNIRKEQSYDSEGNVYVPRISYVIDGNSYGTSNVTGGEYEQIYDIPVEKDASGNVLPITYTKNISESVEVEGGYVYDIPVIYNNGSVVEIQYSVQTQQRTTNDIFGQSYDIKPIYDGEALLKIYYKYQNATMTNVDRVKEYFVYAIPVEYDENDEIKQVYYYNSEYSDITTEVDSKDSDSIKIDFSEYGRCTGKIQEKSFVQSQKFVQE